MKRPYRRNLGLDCLPDFCLILWWPPTGNTQWVCRSEFRLQKGQPLGRSGFTYPDTELDRFTLVAIHDGLGDLINIPLICAFLLQVDWQVAPREDLRHKVSEAFIIWLADGEELCQSLIELVCIVLADETGLYFLGLFVHDDRHGIELKFVRADLCKDLIWDQIKQILACLAVRAPVDTIEENHCPLTVSLTDKLEGITQIFMYDLLLSFFKLSIDVSKDCIVLYLCRIIAWNTEYKSRVKTVKFNQIRRLNEAEMEIGTMASLKWFNAAF